ncbi:hypothetical protein [Streptomyces lydicus]|uniref:hypothetical protein n=1 Tax=Streptomyces lydicus TaxID=47763 RepID=UPI001F50E820|nr:hypothetical protein [Streptomyces lydicus]MCZ1005922.1 hypothetical protein [Streptomyces lydicus]
MPLAHAEAATGPAKTSAMVSCTRNYTCSSLSSGELYHQKYTNNRASTRYKKTGGSSITARVGFNRAGSTSWSGWFSQSSGTTKTGNWNNISYCSSTVALLQVPGQQTFQMPLADCS